MPNALGDDWHYVADVGDLEDREPHPFEISGRELALVLLDGEVYAISNICTHEYACLSDGYVEEDRIVCQLHLAEFHIPTGKAVEDPADIDLHVYPVKLVEQGVYVQIAP